MISGDGPTSVTMDSQGRFAYVTNAIDSTVSTIFAVDAATGALTPRSTVSAGTNPVALTLDASGRFAYVVTWAQTTSHTSLSIPRLEL